MYNTQLIENTIIPYDLSAEEKNKRYNDLSKYINSILPKKLYRFKTVSERSLNQLYYDELGFSPCNTLNDDFEARIYYNKKELYNWLDSILADKHESELHGHIMNMSQIPQEYQSIIPNVEYHLNIYKSISKETFHDVLNHLVSGLFNNLDATLDVITENVQRTTKIACFTEKIYSDMMWGQYACNATGFALEYEFGSNNCILYNDKQETGYNTWLNIFPIIYGNQRTDTTLYAKYLYQIKILQKAMLSNGTKVDMGKINNIFPCPDEFMITKLAIKKSNDWKREKEWRMFLVSNNPGLVSQQYPSVTYKPSAVYLGRKISDINKKIIIDIAKEKQIPVYRMGFNDNSRTYRLRAYKVRG